ncbi:tetratricopeptide repeat protein [Magnetospira sp. QH-2]|uniref:tetratricopeptide repeat protein n=1 Tax=Magnetospira sp. (strain QH-2) TaxID=1288970 RepID=UPI0011DCA58D|nr:tetratricopeptide repeat protein [Magnetospira sp. QH-2]
MTDSTQLFFSQPLRDLHTGNGVYPAPDRAVSWLRLAARKGHPEALYNLEKRYLTGDGLSKNENSHGVYLLMAAERNHANAQRELGILYLQSSEDTIQVYKALVWLLRARKNGLDVHDTRSRVRSSCSTASAVNGPMKRLSILNSFLSACRVQLDPFGTRKRIGMDHLLPSVSNIDQLRCYLGSGLITRR